MSKLIAVIGASGVGKTALVRALANQVDYLLRRASPRIGLIDGGLDLDFHGFTRLTSASSAQASTAGACSRTRSLISAGASTTWPARRYRGPS